MIQNILQLLILDNDIRKALRKNYKKSEIIEIAKGKYEYPDTIKKIIRQWQRK
jgi:N-acetyl-gamma-glutamylphosphate reductase